MFWVGFLVGAGAMLAACILLITLWMVGFARAWDRAWGYR